jgi:hypothetical protein
LLVFPFAGETLPDGFWKFPNNPFFFAGGGGGGGGASFFQNDFVTTTARLFRLRVVFVVLCVVIGVVEVVVVVNIFVVKISSLDMTRHLFCGGKS